MLSPVRSASSPIFMAVSRLPTLRPGFDNFWSALQIKRKMKVVAKTSFDSPTQINQLID